MLNKKPVIGIVGAVGSGKSTVASMFQQLGCGLIDADKLNHEILKRPDIIQKLSQWWGEKILDEQGYIDRQIVAEIVFDDKEQLQRLTNLVHPIIQKKQNILLNKYLNDDKIKAIVLDIPLLIESGQEKLCDCIVFVNTDQANRLFRLRKNRLWTEKKLKKIENLQLALDKKRKISEYIVDNNSGIPATASQVSDILSLVLKQNKTTDYPHGV